MPYGCYWKMTIYHNYALARYRKHTKFEGHIVRLALRTKCFPFWMWIFVIQLSWYFDTFLKGFNVSPVFDVIYILVVASLFASPARTWQRHDSLSQHVRHVMQAELEIAITQNIQNKHRRRKRRKVGNKKRIISSRWAVLVAYLKKTSESKGYRTLEPIWTESEHIWIQRSMARLHRCLVASTQISPSCHWAAMHAMLMVSQVSTLNFKLHKLFLVLNLKHLPTISDVKTCQNIKESRVRNPSWWV